MTMLQRGFEAQAKALREFGYPSVTADQIAAAHGKWLRGDPPENIIEMFSKSAFEERPDVFGKPL